MYKKIIYFVSIISLTHACNPKVPLQSAYFNSPTKTGVIFISREIVHTGRSYGGAAGGIILMNQLKQGSKYGEALLSMAQEVNPTEKIRNFYMEVFAARGKKLVMIDEKAIMNLEKFKAPDSGKRYYKKDLRFLKEKYNIDELLIVTVRYGINSNYIYGVEIKRSGMTSISPEIVVMRDNSIFSKDHTSVAVKIIGPWNTPPYYENIRKAIFQSAEDALKVEEEKYTFH
jgi:hypothetical protein